METKCVSYAWFWNLTFNFQVVTLSFMEETLNSGAMPLSSSLWGGVTCFSNNDTCIYLNELGYFQVRDNVLLINVSDVVSADGGGTIYFKIQPMRSQSWSVAGCQHELLQHQQSYQAGHCQQPWEPQGLVWTREHPDQRPARRFGWEQFGWWWSCCYCFSDYVKPTLGS